MNITQVGSHNRNIRETYLPGNTFAGHCVRISVGGYKKAVESERLLWKCKIKNSIDHDDQLWVFEEDLPKVYLVLAANDINHSRTDYYLKATNS